MNDEFDIDICNMTYQEIIEHPVFQDLFKKTKDGFLLRDPKNDRFFHFIFSHLDDPKCMHILKVIIKATLGIEFTKAELINPQLLPNTFSERFSTLDILIKLDDKIYVNIEMQNSKFSDEHNIRIQTYGHKLASKLLTKGKTYINNPCYQIIFINDIDSKNPCLIRKLKTVDNKQIVQPKMLLKTVFVHMPYIENISKVKSTDHFSEFELINYYFYYRKECDILNIEGKVIQYMEDKLTDFSMDIGEEMTLFRIELERREKQRTEERLKLAEQNIQLAEQNIKLAEQNIKLAEQREYESSKVNCMDLFLFIYPNSDNSFLENLSTTQYNLLHKAILERKSIEELKSLVH